MAVRSDEEYIKRFGWNKGDVTIIRDGVAIDLDTGKPLPVQPQEVLDGTYLGQKIPEDDDE